MTRCVVECGEVRRIANNSRSPAEVLPRSTLGNRMDIRSFWWHGKCLSSYLWSIEDPSRHEGKCGKGRIVGLEKSVCLERGSQ